MLIRHCWDNYTLYLLFLFAVSRSIALVSCKDIWKIMWCLQLSKWLIICAVLGRYNLSIHIVDEWKHNCGGCLVYYTTKLRSLYSDTVTKKIFWHKMNSNTIDGDRHRSQDIAPAYISLKHLISNIHFSIIWMSLLISQSWNVW